MLVYRHAPRGRRWSTGSIFIDVSLFFPQLPDSTPNQIIGTAAEIVQQGRPGASPVRVPLHVSLRFLCRYVQTAQPVRSLAEAWPRLVALLRGGVAALPYAPVGLAVILWEWVQRMNEMGDASPLTKSRERHEVSRTQHKGLWTEASWGTLCGK
eukprot:scaffold292700_cov30-Tisochrysis_lutea.AAC.4